MGGNTGYRRGHTCNPADPIGKEKGRFRKGARGVDMHIKGKGSVIGESILRK